MGNKNQDTLGKIACSHLRTAKEMGRTEGESRPECVPILIKTQGPPLRPQTSEVLVQNEVLPQESVAPDLCKSPQNPIPLANWPLLHPVALHRGTTSFRIDAFACWTSPDSNPTRRQEQAEFASWLVLNLPCEPPQNASKKEKNQLREQTEGGLRSP